MDILADSTIVLKGTQEEITNFIKKFKQELSKSSAFVQKALEDIIADFDKYEKSPVIINDSYVLTINGNEIWEDIQSFLYSLSKEMIPLEIVSRTYATIYYDEAPEEYPVIDQYSAPGEKFELCDFDMIESCGDDGYHDNKIPNEEWVPEDWRTTSDVLNAQEKCKIPDNAEPSLQNTTLIFSFPANWKEKEVANAKEFINKAMTTDNISKVLGEVKCECQSFDKQEYTISASHFFGMISPIIGMLLMKVSGYKSFIKTIKKNNSSFVINEFLRQTPQKNNYAVSIDYSFLCSEYVDHIISEEKVCNVFSWRENLGQTKDDWANWYSMLGLINVEIFKNDDWAKILRNYKKIPKQYKYIINGGVSDIFFYKLLYEANIYEEIAEATGDCDGLPDEALNIIEEKLIKPVRAFYEPIVDYLGEIGELAKSVKEISVPDNFKENALLVIGSFKHLKKAAFKDFMEENGIKILTKNKNNETSSVLCAGENVKDFESYVNNNMTLYSEYDFA